MEEPATAQFVVINVEQCVPSSATEVLRNEAGICREGGAASPPRPESTGEAASNKLAEVVSKTSQDVHSSVTASHRQYNGYYGEIFSYLTSKSFPEGVSESSKRMLKKSCQYYCVLDGVLHYGHKNPKIVVCEKEEQREILARVHIEERTGVHRGARKMYKLINSTMFWRYMYVDVTNYIKECKKCVDYFNENEMCVADNEDAVKSLHVWEKVYVQILGPYPKTASRNEFAVTIVDPVSQWIVAQPVASDSSLASRVACLIFKTFCDLGFARCVIGSVPPQVSADVLSQLERHEGCLRKVAAVLGVPPGASRICHLVKCEDEPADCAWLGDLFSAWVGDNPSSWDQDLDEFLFKFRASPQNGAPSPFRAMFNRHPVVWTDADKENDHALQQNFGSMPPKRRKLHGSVMKCRHCEELFTSKMSFRIHQRKHTEEAKHQGLMEGEEPLKHVNHGNIAGVDGSRSCRRPANENNPDPATGSVVNVWKRLKKIANKGSQTLVAKPQLREEVQKQLRANAVAAVKNIILAAKDTHKKRGKYQKYPQNVQDEMARYAVQHGVLKTTQHFSEKLGVRVSHSTIRNIVKLHHCFTPQLKEEIGRFAAGFGVEAASRHFSERLGRDVRKRLVRKFKRLYVSRISDSTGRTECGRHLLMVSSKNRSIIDERLKEDIGKHACEAGVASTVNVFMEKHSLRLKESLVRRLRKQYLENNKPPADVSVLPELCQQHKHNANTDGKRPYEDGGSDVHASYAEPAYHNAAHIQTSGHLLSQQNCALNFASVNHTTNTTGFLSYQQVPSSTTPVIVNQDSVSVPVFQQPQQVFSSVTQQGHIIQGNMVPVPSSLASVPNPHFHFQPPLVTTQAGIVRSSEASSQPENHFQQVSRSSAITAETTVATVHVIPPLPQKQHPQTENNSSPHVLPPQAVVIHQNHHHNTVDSSYPATIVQSSGEKVTMLSALETSGATLMADMDGTYTLATCVPAGEKSLYKPLTFHLPTSQLDTVAVAVCRDDSQSLNDVIVTIVPTSENDKKSCKDNASYQDCQSVSNSTFILEKDQQYVYQKQVNKHQARVIPAQVQQTIEHFHDEQPHEQQLLQEQSQQQKIDVPDPQLFHLLQPLSQEQVETSYLYMHQNSQQPHQQEKSQKPEYPQNQQELHPQQQSQKPPYPQNQHVSYQHEQQTFQLQQQNDCSSLQTHQNRQVFLLQPHLHQEQPEKVQKQTLQQSQEHSQHMQHLLQQPFQLQGPEQKAVQNFKNHLYYPQQLFILQSNLNQDQLQKPANQQNQLPFLQLQQQQSQQQQQQQQQQKQQQQQQKQQQQQQQQQQIIKGQSEESVHQQRQKLHGHQQQMIQIQQLVSSEQSCDLVDQQKQQQLLHDPQESLFQLQLQFDQEQQSSPHKPNQRNSDQAKLILTQGQAPEPIHHQKQQHLHEPEHEVQQQQKFVQEQTQDPVHLQKEQCLHQTQQQVLQLQQQIIQKQNLLKEGEQPLLRQSEHEVVVLQEQVKKLTDKEKPHLYHSQHQALQLQQHFVLEKPHEPEHQKEQKHLHHSQHQVLLLQHQSDQEQPQTPENHEKEQNSHSSVLQEQFVHKEPQKPSHQKKKQKQSLRQQQQLGQEPQQEQSHLQKQHLHLSRHKVLHQQQRLGQVQPEGSVHQEKHLQHMEHSHHTALNPSCQEKDLQLEQLDQPFHLLHCQHDPHHKQLKKGPNQQDHPQSQQRSFNPQQDVSETHHLHNQSLQSQEPQESQLEEVHSPQEFQDKTQVIKQNPHQDRQSEVLQFVKLSCTFEEEESTDDPNEMVIYVSDATESVREDTTKEQRKVRPPITRKCPNRNKSKAGESASQKRGNYMLYSPELRAELGKYAAEHGNQKAREYFREILGHDVPESTIRGLRDKYILKCHMNSNAPGGINNVTSLGYSPRGRPLRLGKYDDIVRECIQDLVQSGEKISKFLAIATAKQVLMQYEPELLVENGGSIKLTNAWAKSFLRRIGVQPDS